MDATSGKKRADARQAYDPICGARLEGSALVLASQCEYKKRKYSFCSQRCKHEFEQATERIRVHEAARAGALFSVGKVRWGLA